MKVIGAGFGRTGTMSLKVALEELGAGPCFHCLDPSPAAGAEGPSQARRQASPWAEQPGSDTEVDWQAALAGWGSTVGWLGARFYREMLDAWPDALVLLSVRDPETWYASARNTINADGPIADRVFGGRIAEREHALGLYRRHNEQVMSTVPPERLLVYEVAQGWEPLSEFLGVQAPEAPFPHLNRAKSLREEVRSPQPSRSETLRRAGSTHASQPARARRRPSVPTARIAGLTVADSPTTFSQEDVLSLLGLKGDEFAERIFARSGVQRRHLNLDVGLPRRHTAGPYRAGRGRTDAVRDPGRRPARRRSPGNRDRRHGEPLLAGLPVAGAPARSTTTRWIRRPTSTTSAASAARAPCRCCAWPRQTLPEHPGKHSLVVAAESMSSLLTRARPGDQRAKTVGSAIFGDGCGAALLSSAHDAAGPTIVASQVHQIGDTLGAVSLALSAEDSYLHLARELPDLAAAGLGELVAGFLHRNRLGRSDVDHWIVHPGGRRIVESVQDVLELSREEVAISWEALAEHGNVGTPSIIYVLKDTIEQRHPRTGEHGLMVTIGPGVSVGLMLLQF